MTSSIELWLVVQPAQGEPAEVVVEAPMDATVAQLAEALTARGGNFSTGRVRLFSRRLQTWLPADATLEASRLASGDTLIVGDEGETTNRNTTASRPLELGLVQLRIEAGPSAGARHGLRV